MPIMPSDSKSAVPPWLMNTSGTPVNGKTPIIDAMFMNDCTVTMVIMPITRSLANGSPKLSFQATSRRLYQERSSFTQFLLAPVILSPTFSNWGEHFLMKISSNS